MSALPNNSPALAAAMNELIGSNLASSATVQFTISTRSMLPLLAPGDRVIVRGLRAGEPNIGDVVMSRTGQDWVVHRLIDRCVVGGKPLVVTQGDNCQEPDPYWSPEQIRGRIVTVWRGSVKSSLESRRARWSGVIVARLLRWRARDRSAAGARKGFALKIGSAFVRVATWFV